MRKYTGPTASRLNQIEELREHVERASLHEYEGAEVVEGSPEAEG